MKQIYTAAIFLIFASACLRAQTITTIAGAYLGNGVQATSLSIASNHSTLDAAGNLFIADPEKHVVRKLSPDNKLTVIAGTGISGYSGDGGTATSAELGYPYDITFDLSGNLFIADTYSQRIRKVSVAGIITTIAGTGVSGFSGDGGPAVNAQLNGANAVATDRQGNVYVADFYNGRVRKIDGNGIITTVAGTGEFGSTGDGGVATAAKLGYPLGIAVDSLGQLYISDVSFDVIRKVNTAGIISTIAGSSQPVRHGFSGDGGPATSATFSGIAGSVAVDGQGNIFVPDTRNSRIRKIDANGIITTVAGNGGGSSDGDGGLATQAQLEQPQNVSADTAGNLFISTGFYIRKVNKANTISTVAGNGFSGYNGSGIATDSMQLYRPQGIAIDDAGNIYTGGIDYLIRKISKNGITTTYAGTGISGDMGNGVPATSATLPGVYGLTRDDTGNLFVSNLAVIKKIDRNGIITVVAGTGNGNGSSADGGPATAANILTRGPVAVDAIGNLYIADQDRARIRKVDVNGIITTIAGTGVEGFSGDGGLATDATLNFPNSVAIAKDGSILLADAGNRRVRKIDRNGIITTFAGNGSEGFSGDNGLAINASLAPVSFAVDSSGNIYINDNYERIRKIDMNGIITTVTGGGSVYGDGGDAKNAQLSGLSSIAVDEAGDLYLTDNVNHRLRKIYGLTLPVTLTSFAAIQKRSDVVVTWNTDNEANILTYSVERSYDGAYFTSIGQVLATGRGSHQFTDINPALSNTKKIWYRLQITEKSGEESFSKTVNLYLAHSGVFVAVYPNPAKQTLYVKGEAIREITLADLTGRIIVNKPATGLITSLPVFGLKRGIYLLKAYKTDGTSYTEKVILNE